MDAADANAQCVDAAQAAQRGDFAAAGERFARAAAALPEPIAAIQGALFCAGQLALNGRAPPPVAPPAAPDPDALLSVIVCSIDATKLSKFRASLARSVAGPHELVHIPDARSLCEGYTRALARARGDLLVFCHDDIEFLIDDLHARVATHLSRHDLVGPAGTRKVSGAAWIWGGPPANDGWIAHPGRNGTIGAWVYGPNGPVVEHAQSLDGLFLATRRDVVERIGFDADTFDGFDFYDMDFSYRAQRAGLRVTIACDLLVIHDSEGDFGKTYAHFARRFFAKFPDLPLGPRHPDPNFAILEMPDRAGVRCVYEWLSHWHRV